MAVRSHDSARRPGAGPAAAPSSGQPGKSTQVEAHAASVPRLQLHDVKGGADNVDPASVNPHPGFDHNRIGDRRGQPFHTLHPTHLYLNDGSIGGYGNEVPAGSAVWINAGAITKLVCRDPKGQLPARPIDCVYVFEYEHHGHWIPAGAWMPATMVPGIVSAEEHAIAQRIARERGDAHHHFSHGIEIVAASAERDGVVELFTYPNQGVHNKVANKAKYYYGNLSLNLPYTGGERVGVLADNIPGPDPRSTGSTRIASSTRSTRTARRRSRCTARARRTPSTASSCTSCSAT